MWFLLHGDGMEDAVACGEFRLLLLLVVGVLQGPFVVFIVLVVVGTKRPSSSLPSSEDPGEQFQIPVGSCLECACGRHDGSWDHRAKRMAKDNFYCATADVPLESCNSPSSLLMTDASFLADTEGCQLFAESFV